MVSVFFADTVNAKARQTSTMTSIILASPCGDRETMQAVLSYMFQYNVIVELLLHGCDLGTRRHFNCFNGSNLKCFYDSPSLNHRLHEPENKDYSPLQAAKLKKITT